MKGRDANHSDFCGIIRIFKYDFCITISDLKILAKKDFEKVADKIKVAAPISDYGIKIWLFPYKIQTGFVLFIGKMK